MLKSIRISILLLVLLVVSVNTWLSQARSTDWNNSLYVKVYPINADGSDTVRAYIDGLSVDTFGGIEQFIAREAERFGKSVAKPVRMELGQEIHEQPPSLPQSPGMPGVMWWSLKMRMWAGGVTDDQDRIEPDVRIFVRYHSPERNFLLENSIGLQKGMVGIVNAYASRQYSGTNNVVIAHEFLHTLGATDKYEPDGNPVYPVGYAEPDRQPLYPQELAEIMGGRIPQSKDEAIIPMNLKYVLIGEATAKEIRLR